MTALYVTDGLAVALLAFLSICGVREVVRDARTKSFNAIELSVTTTLVVAIAYAAIRLTQGLFA